MSEKGEWTPRVTRTNEGRRTRFVDNKGTNLSYVWPELFELLFAGGDQVIKNKTSLTLI